MRSWRSLCYLLCLFLLLSMPTLQAAGISIPELSLLTHGSMDGDLFCLKSKIDIDLAVEGGDKFLGNLSFGVRSGYLEEDFGILSSVLPDFSDVYDPEQMAALAAYLGASLSIDLKTVSVTIKRFAGIPLDFSFFIGDYDAFCNGGDFPTLFGAPYLSPIMHGYMYFPDGVGGDVNLCYDGLHSIRGTGFELFSRLGDHAAANFYFYQDMRLGSGIYSTDLRFLFNNPAVKLEAFAGYSFPHAELGLARAGLLSYVAAGEYAGLLTQIGLPYVDLSQLGVFGIDQFYFLFEPQLKIGLLKANATVFYHPAYYLFKATDENGSLDINLNVRGGDTAKTGFESGGELLLRFQSNGTASPLTISVSPFVSASMAGILWDAKAQVKVFPFDGGDLASNFQAYLGIKTGF